MIAAIVMFISEPTSAQISPMIGAAIIVFQETSYLKTTLRSSIEVGMNGQTEELDTGPKVARFWNHSKHHVTNENALVAITALPRV